MTVNAMIIAKNKAIFFPWSSESRPKVVIFVAGPVKRKASAAPGEMPFARKIATKGVAPEAQT